MSYISVKKERCTMGKYKIQLDNNHMLSILGNDLDLPYRHQGYLNLIVPYDEYIQFTKMMVHNSLHVLSLTLDTYKNALRALDDSLLLRLFYLDVSCAQANELSLSIRKGVDSTIITHLFDVATKEFVLTDISKCIGEFNREEIQKATKSLLKDLGSIELSNVSEHNSQLLNYALYTRLLSYQQKPIRVNVVSS